MKRTVRDKLRAVGVAAALAMGMVVAAPSSPASAALSCGMTIEVRAANWSAQSGWVYYKSCTHFSGRVKIALKGGSFTSCKTVAPYAIVKWDWISIYGIGYPAGVRSC